MQALAHLAAGLRTGGTLAAAGCAAARMPAAARPLHTAFTTTGAARSALPSSTSTPHRTRRTAGAALAAAAAAAAAAAVGAAGYAYAGQRHTLPAGAFPTPPPGSIAPAP